VAALTKTQILYEKARLALDLAQAGCAIATASAAGAMPAARGISMPAATREL